MSVIDDYLAEHSGPHRALMDEIRALVAGLVPDAEEALSYGMPTFRLHGNLVHFAPGKHHVGLYPGPDGVAFVADELDARGLKHSKGAIQFPADQPLPRDLIERIVTFRAEQQRAKAPTRKSP
ncbi:MAG: iron chaperone [Actinomycetes bacterium]